MTVESPAPAPVERPAPRSPVPAKALAAPLKRFWAGEIDLGRIGMAVTLPVLAWVFYTTSSGMIDIMQKDQNDVVGIAGTLIATTAVLVMLASTSWSLGADLAAARAGEVAAKQRLQHQDERIALTAQEMLLDDIGADLRNVTERYGHGLFLLWCATFKGPRDKRRRRASYRDHHADLAV